MNGFRNITLLLVLLLVTAGVLFGVRRIESRMDTVINQEKLRFSGEVTQAPPAVVFTSMALGSFRGVLADILWLRSETLKSKKNYFEMVQLARWITDLQPNYSGGTAYLAWNLAYNISVTSSDWEDRWYWVNEGIKLIRDKAMVYNPDDVRLYQELAWIYLHKLGNLLDDANLYYKNQLAVLMTNILGSTTPDWELLAAAPSGKEEFLREYPADHPLWAAVKAAGYEGYDELFLAFRTPVKAALPEALRSSLKPETFKAVDAYFRAELLRDKLKLDPKRMVEIDRKYGKMDWRVPESQAIYWATIGVEKSSAEGRKADIKCLRIISTGLQSAFRSGRLLTLDQDGGYVQVVPNLLLADAAYAAFEAGEAEYASSGGGESFRGAKINYLKDAIPLIYINGNITKAEEFFRKLVAVDGPQRRKTLDEFVMVELAEDVRDADVKKASAVISGLIRRSIMSLIYGDHDAAVANERLARYIHRRFSEDNKDVKRNVLPSYAKMKEGEVNNFRRVMPPAMVAVLDASIAMEKEQAAEAKTPAAPENGAGK